MTVSESDTGEKSIDKTRCFRSGENPTYFVSLSYQNEMRYAYMVTTIRIPDELHQRIKMAAERQGMTLKKNRDGAGNQHRRRQARACQLECISL